MTEFFNRILEWFNTFLQFLLDVLLYVPMKIWETLLDALITVIETIPVPQFLNDFTTVFNNFLSLTGVPYFIDLLNIGEGFAILITAKIFVFVFKYIVD